MLVLLLGVLFLCLSFFPSISKDAKSRVAVRNSLCISNMIGLVKNRLCAELICTYSTEYLQFCGIRKAKWQYMFSFETREHLIG